MRIMLLLLISSIISSCSLARLDKKYDSCYKHCEFMGMELEEVRVDGSCLCVKCK